MNEGREGRSPDSAQSRNPKSIRKRIVVLTAPSGGGKTTIARHVMDAVPDLRFSVSATTRSPRPREREGVDYYFVDRERFEQYVDNGDLLEFEEVYPGLFYGTLRREVERKALEGPVLLDVDVRGAEAIKGLYAEDALVIFIRPPTFDTLEARLRNRETEDATTLNTRLARAREELEHAERFDAVVINADVDEAVSETLRLIRQFLKDE